MPSKKNPKILDFKIGKTLRSIRKEKHNSQFGEVEMGTRQPRVDEDSTCQPQPNIGPNNNNVRIGIQTNFSQNVREEPIR